ncbi:Nif11-like leader peptide family RiPP precursor [Aetokthonos hydrillicola]|uniref:Nif11-like leader peptide family RiPP precursor n=1 Tax=Aetokthonos hydrillicola TaxID=1550245 RepID=UPI001ABA212E|nr:Nif11-like leader peptide family RiPP precursor [Aetokthonos hydrillicola]
MKSAKSLYLRLVTDIDFLMLISQISSKEECKRILQELGYDFTWEEWEIATTKLQIANSEDDELTEEQLRWVSGGITRRSGTIFKFIEDLMR